MSIIIREQYKWGGGGEEKKEKKKEVSGYYVHLVGRNMVYLETLLPTRYNTSNYNVI